MRKTFILIASASLLFLGISSVLFHRLNPWCLTVFTPGNGQVIYRSAAKDGAIFSLQYNHSVTNRPVESRFAVTEKGRILPLSTTFDTFGPGLPSLDGSSAYVEKDGAYTVFHLEEPREKLSLFVSPLTEERLIFGNRELELSKFQETPLLIHIYAERKWRLKFFRQK